MFEEKIVSIAESQTLQKRGWKVVEMFYQDKVKVHKLIKESPDVPVIEQPIVEKIPDKLKVETIEKIRKRRRGK